MGVRDNEIYQKHITNTKYFCSGVLYVLNVYYLHQHKKIKWVAAAVPLRPHTDEGKRNAQSVKNDVSDVQEKEKPSALEAVAAAIVVTGNVIANESVNVTEAAAAIENVCGAGVLGE